MFHILLCLFRDRIFHSGILSYFWSFLAVSSICVICSKTFFRWVCFWSTSAALLYAFLMWSYRVFHSFSTSLSEVESLPRFFWICSAFSDISMAWRLTASRFRFMASVAGEASSTPCFAASATSVISHSVTYW